MSYRRLTEAVELVEKNRRSDGRWPMQNTHTEQLDFDRALDFDVAGRADEASRWNTLRALRVLNWASHHG